MQPWAQVIQPDEPRRIVTLRFHFHISHLPESQVLLAMETPRRFVITLNGHEINTNADVGWWVDPAIRTLPLDPAALTVGDNCLECMLDFRCDDDLEALYLLGDFGVTLSGDAVSIGAPPAMHLGDWRDQDMPFYGGAVVYRYSTRSRINEDERVILEAAAFAGATVRVLVNGQSAGYLSWPPYELDITDHFTSGATEIALELFGSRRNCFGPLHQKNPAPTAIGPGNFKTTGDDWTDGYVLKPHGLLKHPVLKIMTCK